MEFNIREMSLVESIQTDARIDIEQIVGRKFDFRAGLSYSLTLPDDTSQFARVKEPERLFTALKGWARIYGYRDGDVERIHVIAPSEDENGNVVFYRLDFKQSLKPRRGPRPSIEVCGGSIVSYDDCATWLIDLATNWRTDKHQRNLRFVIQRPSLVALRPNRIAWVVPEMVQNLPVRDRLLAIGQVYGVDIAHVPPRDYRDTEAQLAKLLPYDGAVICRSFAPHITAEAVPSIVPRDLIHFCDSTSLIELEAQIRVWIVVVAEELESHRRYESANEEQFLLGLMLRAMLSHSKIGEYSHCTRETVLTVIRARHLNVPAAERILDMNSEAHEDRRTSDSLFLWKAHHEGRQYFLNPRRVDYIKVMAVTTA